MITLVVPQDLRERPEEIFGGQGVRAIHPHTPHSWR